MKILRKFFFLVAVLGALSLTSCGHFIKLRGPSLETPETQGIGSGEVSTFLTQSYKIKPSPDFRDTPISKRETVAAKIHGGVDNALGILDFLDINVGIGAAQPIDIGAKLQFLGDPRSAAKGGNISAAVKFSYGLGVAGGEVTEEQQSPQTRTWTVDAGVPHYEAMFGYRISDPILLWLSYYRKNYSYVTDFTDGVKDTIRHSGNQSAFSLGFGFNTDIILAKLAIAKVSHNLKTDEVTEKDGIQAALSFGINW